ncbi:MAG: alcohol dehydrogenase catalytic domain-containing protein [Euzebyales bacterium]|nr:alcohol dehydrogenase catalytic domain-containing protein [Euzebyales bacterium]
MRGLVLEGVRQVAYRTDLPDPTIQEPLDAIVAVRRAGLCGSDLHPYEGREAVRFGVVPGHEVVGEVAAVGSGVARFRPGDRILVPFTTSCGACPACREGLSARCRHGSVLGYGPADDPDAPALGGGQAELVRVPLADATLVRAPEALTDTDAILLTDNLPTGWYAAERADMAAGDTVAVVGLGSVGLCAVVAARALGAGCILGVDPVEHRRRRAEELGATALHPDAARDAVASLPGAGQGAAAVIEAAGTPPAQALAYALLRPGGTLSVIAVQTSRRFGFTPAEAYDANLTVRFGRAPVRSVLDRLLPRLERGELSVPGRLVVTHPEMPLSDGPDTYRRFAAREPGMVKAVFVP